MISMGTKQQKLNPRPGAVSRSINCRLAPVARGDAMKKPDLRGRVPESWQSKSPGVDVVAAHRRNPCAAGRDFDLRSFESPPASRGLSSGGTIAAITDTLTGAVVELFLRKTAGRVLQ
jgi:hypothetical protein